MGRRPLTLWYRWEEGDVDVTGMVHDRQLQASTMLSVYHLKLVTQRPFQKHYQVSCGGVLRSEDSLNKHFRAKQPDFASYLTPDLSRCITDAIAGCALLCGGTHESLLG